MLMTNNSEGPDEKSFEALESKMEEVRLRKKNSMISKYRQTNMTVTEIQREQNPFYIEYKEQEKQNESELKKNYIESAKEIGREIEQQKSAYKLRLE